MTVRVAINGYGRIGRHVLRAFCETAGQNKLWGNIEFVAINDIGSADSIAHLTKYDTTHGRFSGDVVLQENFLQVNSQCLEIFCEENPENLPWGKLNIDVVLECTGQFRAKSDAEKHLKAGAKKVIIGAVPFDEADAITVFGINHQTLSDEKVISNASCTTHCLAPLLSTLQQAAGIQQVMMTEVHSYTSDQHLLDTVHRDLRRARAGAQNMIPTTSSSINAIQTVLPKLNGKIAGHSIRVPTINVACVDLTVQLEKNIDVNAVFLEASKAMPHIMAYNDEELVSMDFCGRTESAIFDATQTQHINDNDQTGLIKLVAWYDNEWGYTHRLLDLLSYIANNKAISW